MCYRPLVGCYMAGLMAKIHRELADPKKHSDFMSSSIEGGMPVSKSRSNLVPKWVYLADVYNFTFQFASIEQVRQCIAYFESKTHPSTISQHPPHEHYWHPWYCKLPKGINKGVRKQKVLKVLKQIIARWG